MKHRLSQDRFPNSKNKKFLALLAGLFVIVTNQNCTQSEGTGGIPVIKQNVEMISERYTVPTPGEALGTFPFTSIKSIEYRAPAGGFPRPGISVDSVGMLATFNGSSLLPIKVSWSVVDFDQVIGECYIFVSPLDIHPDFINSLLGRLAKTSLNKVRMPEGKFLTCLDCKSEPQLRITLHDTTSHGYLFSHESLDSTPVIQIEDPESAVEKSFSEMITFVSEPINTTNPQNHCSAP